MTTITRRASRLALALTVTATSVLVLATTAAAAGANRTWISGVGDDVNPCSRTAPCKTLAGAISKTADGGEINAIDGGGFGAVTITKSITIDLRGVQGSILNAGLTGIVINAPNDDVTIRNISIDCAGIDPTPAAPACPYTANTTGIRVFAAGSVRLQSVDIISQAVAGVRIDSSTSTPIVTAQDLSIHNVCGAAVQATPTTPTTGTSVLLDGASLTNSGTGVLATGNVDVRVGRSTIADTGVGLSFTSPATVRSLGGNQFSFNGTDGEFTDGVAPADAAPIVNPTPVTVNPTPVTVTPTPPGPVTVQSVVQTVRELVVALADSEFDGLVGKPLKLRYVATAKGEATLIVRSGKTVVAEIDAAAARGRNVVTWNGKVKGKFAAAGSYRVQLDVLGTDGQTDTDTAVVVLARPAKATPGSANSVKPKPAKPVRR